MIIIALAFVLLAPILISNVYAEHSDDPIENWKEFQDGLDYVSCPEPEDCVYHQTIPYDHCIGHGPFWFSVYHADRGTRTVEGKFVSGLAIYKVYPEMDYWHNNKGELQSAYKKDGYGPVPSWLENLNIWHKSFDDNSNRLISCQEKQQALNYYFSLYDKKRFSPMVFPDYDGDGITVYDECPTSPEDFNKYEDSDGCPEGGVPDYDGDGITVYDECPYESETFNNFNDLDGCPDFIDPSIEPLMTLRTDKNNYYDHETVKISGTVKNLLGYGNFIFVSVFDEKDEEITGGELDIEDGAGNFAIELSLSRSWDYGTYKVLVKYGSSSSSANISAETYFLIQD